MECSFIYHIVSILSHQVCFQSQNAKLSYWIKNISENLDQSKSIFQLFQVLHTIHGDVYEINLKFYTLKNFYHQYQNFPSL